MSPKITVQLWRSSLMHTPIEGGDEDRGARGIDWKSGEPIKGFLR